jgi:hypothetical protein
MSKRRPDNDTDDLAGHIRDLLEDVEATLSARATQSLTKPRFMTALREIRDDFEAKRRKVDLPSFSNVLWRDVAPQFNLDSSKSWHQFDYLSIPNASLPSSFHRKLMLDSPSWLDVYQERDFQDHEAAHIRLMEAVCVHRSPQKMVLFQWHVPVCGLFKGRLVDRPEVPLPATGETSRGRIEHEIYTIEGVLLEIEELKYADSVGRNMKDNFAQVVVLQSRDFA